MNDADHGVRPSDDEGGASHKAPGKRFLRVGDIQNLMAATDVGILFLDAQLRINRFTPRVSALFNIVEGDEGRSITDFTHRLDYDDLAEDARMVVRDFKGTEREVRGKDGSWYLARLRPYRTVEDKLDGVVATFVDIGERRRTEDALRESESRLILVGELHHRMRNLIGVVMALADRTAVGSPSLDAFRTSLADRLMALARVQGLLSRAPSVDRVTFDELVASELSAQSVENDAGVTLDGPRGVVLRFISVQALAMALHELATNAVKYGALGRRTGRLRVRWRVQAENGSPSDSCRLKGKRRRDLSTYRQAKGGGQWSAPYRGRLVLPVRSSDNFRDRTGRRPLHDRTSALRTSNWGRSRMANSPLRDRRISSSRTGNTDRHEPAGCAGKRGIGCRGPGSVRRQGDQDNRVGASHRRRDFDVNLGGVLAYPVADMLIARKIPFVFTSGYEDNVLRSRYAQIKNCPKPYMFQAMEEALVEAMSLS